MYIKIFHRLSKNRIIFYPLCSHYHLNYFLSQSLHWYVNISTLIVIDNLLIAVASITGIFLSLYFTGQIPLLEVYMQNHRIQSVIFHSGKGLEVFPLKFIIWLT